MPEDEKYSIANEIYKMSLKYNNLNVDLICATITHESALTWRKTIKSPVGAMGLMQIMPQTGILMAKKEGIEWKSAEKTLFDPITNIRLGCRYLSFLIAQSAFQTYSSFAMDDMQAFAKTVALLKGVHDVYLVKAHTKQVRRFLFWKGEFIDSEKDVLSNFWSDFKDNQGLFYHSDKYIQLQLSTLGSVIACVNISVQLLLSVIVNVYEPATKLEISSVVAALSHK